MTDNEAFNQLFIDDPYLTPYKNTINQRAEDLKRTLAEINSFSTLEEFSRSYESMGFSVSPSCITYREWAPGAKEAFLIGEFNNWDRNKHPMKRDEFGVFTITLNHINGAPAIQHGTKVKISMFH